MSAPTRDLTTELKNFAISCRATAANLDKSAAHKVQVIEQARKNGILNTSGFTQPGPEQARAAWLRGLADSADKGVFLFDDRPEVGGLVLSLPNAQSLASEAIATGRVVYPDRGGFSAGPTVVDTIAGTRQASDATFNNY